MAMEMDLSPKTEVEVIRQHFSILVSVSNAKAICRPSQDTPPQYMLKAKIIETSDSKILQCENTGLMHVMQLNIGMTRSNRRFVTEFQGEQCVRILRTSVRAASNRLA